MNADPVTPDEVFAALERVLDSDVFRAAPQSRNFLAFVVTETLAGRGDNLSERTVGRGALYRPADFDGRFDAGVRVQATRVRKALAAYNETSTDSVQIWLRAGSYVPEFRPVEREAPPPLETAVVVTTTTGDNNTLTEALAQEMVRQLDAFPGLRVVGPIAGDEPGAVATGLGVRFALHVSSAAEETAADLTVLDTTSHATVWTTREPWPTRDPAGLDVGRWAQGITGRIGDYTGVILTRAGESMRPQRDEWRAMQAYYAAFTTGDRNAVLPAAELLTEVVAGGRRSPAILAALAHCLSLRAGYEFSVDINADLKEATSMAEEVLVVDPDSATAHLTLATVALLRNEPETAQDHARRAAELAAYHPSLLETAGTLTALAGGWDDGVSFIRQAMRLNPHLPGYMRQLIALDHLFSGDDALALAEASRIDAPTDEWGPYLRALALMGLGYRERAEAEMAQARAIEPSVLDERDEPMPTWVQLSPEQTQILKDRLQMFHSPD